MTEERTDQNGAPVAEADVDAEDRLDAEAVQPETDGETEEAEIVDAAAVAEEPAETEQADADAAEEPATETPLTDSSAVGEELSYLDMDDSEYSSEEYAEMLAMYDETMREIAEGEIVQATIVRITNGAAILDVGFKSEGSVPLDEFRDPSELEAGDKVEVFLESLEDQEGVVVLSKKKADFLRVWEGIKTAFDDNQPVPGMIKRKIKGGATVDLMGVDAFLPGSQIALRRVHNIEDLIGQEYDFKILKLNKRRRNIVVSRRVILEEERAGKRDDLKQELEVASFTSPTCPGGASGTPRRCVTSARISRSRSSTLTGIASAFRSDSSSCSLIPGRMSPRSTPSGPGFGARSYPSPTTARSSSWRRAWRGSSTSPR